MLAAEPSLKYMVDRTIRCYAFVMSREDALFRAIRPTAEALAVRHLQDGDGAAIDVNQLTEQVLSLFRQALDIRDHEASLRPRVSAFLQELATRQRS